MQDQVGAKLSLSVCLAGIDILLTSRSGADDGTDPESIEQLNFPPIKNSRADQPDNFLWNGEDDPMLSCQNLIDVAWIKLNPPLKAWFWVYTADVLRHAVKIASTGLSCRR